MKRIANETECNRTESENLEIARIANESCVHRLCNVLAWPIDSQVLAELADHNEG